MIKLRTAIALAGFALASISLHAQAQQERAPGWLHVGVAHVGFNSDTSLKVGGATVPGANAEASNNTTFGIELGYEVAPSVIVSLTAGAPPTTKLVGRGGPVDGIELGKVRYAPAVLSAHYHFDLGPVKPYVGAGVNYTMVLKSENGFVSDLDVKNAWGSVIQLGVDVPLADRWSFFIDVKKIFLKTKATGTLPAFGGAPAQADVRLDPLLTHAGISWRF